MAQAPTPGAGREADALAGAKTVVTITVRGESHSVAPMNLPLSETLVFRKATGGMSVESFWSGEQSIGIDSVKTLWWLARRADGEFSLTLARAWDEWPDDLAPDELDVSVADPEADTPEA